MEGTWHTNTERLELLHIMMWITSVIWLFFLTSQNELKTDCPHMCAYKLVTVKFRWWGLQTKVENFIHKVIDNNTFMLTCAVESILHVIISWFVMKSWYIVWVVVKHWHLQPLFCVGQQRETFSVSSNWKEGRKNKTADHSSGNRWKEQ